MTETIEIDNSQGQSERWPLRNAFISDENGKTMHFSGLLEFTASEQRKIIISRKSTGDLTISIVTNGSGGRLNSLIGTPGAMLGTNVTIVVPCSSFANKPLLLPVYGKLTIGQFPNFDLMEPNCLLQTGTITVRGHCLFTNEVYEAGSTELLLGEVFDAEDNSRWKGYLLFNESPGFKAAADAITKKGILQNYFTENSSIRISIADRIKNDHGLQLVWIVFAWLLGLYKLFEEQIKKAGKKE